MFFGKNSQSGRAHIELVVLMTCIGTLALLISPGRSETKAPIVTPEPTIVASAAATRPAISDFALTEVTSDASDTHAMTVMADRMCDLGHPPASGAGNQSGC